MKFSLIGEISAEAYANWKRNYSNEVLCSPFRSNCWIGKYKVFLRHVGKESDLIPVNNGCIFEYHTKWSHETYEKACLACEEEIAALGIDPWNPTIEILK